MPKQLTQKFSIFSQIETVSFWTCVPRLKKNRAHLWFMLLKRSVEMYTWYSVRYTNICIGTSNQSLKKQISKNFGFHSLNSIPEIQNFKHYQKNSMTASTSLIEKQFCRYSLIHPDTAWYSKIQPDIACYSLIQPDTSWYKLMQPDTAWYSLI